MSGSDRDSLVFFYEEFAGERWFKAMNWCSELPCGRWHGVEMGAGHCTSLKVGTSQPASQPAVVKGRIPFAHSNN